MEKNEEKTNNNNISLLNLKHIESEVNVGIDIGGSLSKLSVVVNKKNGEAINYLRKLTNFEEINLNSDLIFLSLFHTPQETSVQNEKASIFPVLKQLQQKFKIKKVFATGGGAEKFKEVAEKEFHLDFVKHDELLSLVNGYLFLNNSFYDVIFDKNRNISPIPSSPIVFPHLAVNIGTGVSIIKVSSPNPKDIQRMGGTIMGGGTLVGLGITLLGVDNYNDILELAIKGDHKMIDLTVQDIYGSESEDETVAASFGKIPEYINSHKLDTLKKEDIALGLLIMICSHITQLATCLAEKNGIKEVLYLGNFTRRNSLAVLCLERCMKFWGEKVKVKFNYYDGYLGSIGTLVE